MPVAGQLADLATDPAKVEELAGKIEAFRLWCGLERLKPAAGLIEEVILGNPFELESPVSVRLNEKDWHFWNSSPSR